MKLLMGLLVILGLIALMIGEAILGGWVLSVTWGWFVAPTFGLPSLGVAPAIGLALVVGYLTKNPSVSEDTGVGAIAKGIGIAVIRPLVILSMGWIVLQFM